MAILEPITHKYFQLDFQLQIQKSYMEEILKKKKYRPLTSCASITDHSHHVLPSPTTHIMCFHHRPLTSCASITDHSHHVLPSPTTHMCFHHRPLTCASITVHSHHVLPSPTTRMCFHHRPLTSCASITDHSHHVLPSQLHPYPFIQIF